MSTRFEVRRAEGVVFSRKRVLALDEPNHIEMLLNTKLQLAQDKVPGERVAFVFDGVSQELRCSSLAGSIIFETDVVRQIPPARVVGWIFGVQSQSVDVGAGNAVRDSLEGLLEKTYVVFVPSSSSLRFFKTTARSSAETSRLLR